MDEDSSSLRCFCSHFIVETSFLTFLIKVGCKRNNWVFGKILAAPTVEASIHSCTPVGNTETLISQSQIVIANNFDILGKWHFCKCYQFDNFWGLKIKVSTSRLSDKPTSYNHLSLDVFHGISVQWQKDPRRWPLHPLPPPLRKEAAVRVQGGDGLWIH